MDKRVLVNTICGICGALAMIFGLLVRMGVVSAVPASRGMAPIVLGAIIVIWSLLMRKRYR